MSEPTPVEAYLRACDTWQEIYEYRDDADYLTRVRAHNLVLQACFQRLLQAASSQDPEVWYVLGGAFTSGQGTTRDRAEAIRWYQRAAETGHARAMVSLALRLTSPQPSIDRPAAIQWLRKAAELGDPGGMIFLGFAYREGDGVPCDYVESVRWFTKAFEAGDAHSMIHVGRMYDRYLSSPAEAVRWFLRAAEAGFSESYIELALIYDTRGSAVYNPAEAHKWYRVVAEHSEGTNARALLALAHQHLEGVGVPCDVNLAKQWLHRLLLAVPEKSYAHREATDLLKKLDDQFL